ncbi:telomeric repeat-binding factor 1 [Solea solea]|uniref:telomeric repeat-binding factor 1 n=1 Tax=Solea solea TaxID=90069 RepID=UPI00272BFD5F|nr:telomeric repeat-binding factor 1 [Solea solea]
MEAETSNKSVTEAKDAEQSVSFQRVKAVATGWIVDFVFVSLCRHFKEGKFEDFNETLTVFEAISQSSSPIADEYAEKTMICAFIARVMHGKHLDSQFEEDDSVMPLMSAAKIWSRLKVTVADESVFENITVLLCVQSVAVCLESGQTSSASSALNWFKNNYELPQKVRLKLATIVSQRETYDPLLRSFSFNKLLETVKAFLDAYLQKNPSDNLLKEATKMVLSSQNCEALEDSGTEDAETEDAETKDKSLSETACKMKVEDVKKKEGTVLRTKRKLMSTKITDVWKPDSCKKPCVSIKRLSKNELSQIISDKSLNTTVVQKKRKTRQKWTWQLDTYLRKGVDRHGPGKWSRILLDYDFEGRTSTMLKDRWRVLLKSHAVS